MRTVITMYSNEEEIAQQVIEDEEIFAQCLTEKTLEELIIQFAANVIHNEEVSSTEINIKFTKSKVH